MAVSSKSIYVVVVLVVFVYHQWSIQRPIFHLSSQYPFLWAVSYVDETNLSFLHIVDLNFPARVTRTQFLCEAKVQAMAVITDSATEENPEVRFCGVT